MDMITLASQYIFLPLCKHTQKLNIKNSQRYLLESQFLPKEQIEANNLRDLQRMLRYAYDHSRFYRENFKQHNATPDDIKSLSDFARLPILSKDDVRNNLDDLISDEFNKTHLIWKRTGGSTGVPLQLYWDRNSVKFKEALTRRHNSWAHFLPGEKRAFLWGDIKVPLTFRKKVSNALAGRMAFLDTLKMDDQNMMEFIERIRQTKTRLLFGHAHSIYFLIQFLKDKNITDLDFDGIISTAEMLLPEERQLVEEMFGKVVFDRYGCEEIGLIASECEEHDGMHIAAEGVYVEILYANEREPGRVIVTDLVNRGSPLIRYEIGDLATTKLDKCPCGRGLPRIGRVFGRTSDILYSPEGKRISGVSILDTFIIHIVGFKQVQIIQEKLDELTFNIVKDENFSNESLEKLANCVTKCFGHSMKYKVTFLERIPLTERGKFQFSICRLKDSDVP